MFIVGIVGASFLCIHVKMKHEGHFQFRVPIRKSLFRMSVSAKKIPTLMAYSYEYIQSNINTGAGFSLQIYSNQWDAKVANRQQAHHLSLFPSLTLTVRGPSSQLSTTSPPPAKPSYKNSFQTIALPHNPIMTGP